ncbi:MAG: phospholipase D-like domain-containing protein [Simkaniaceae bacterium]|nr:phospholipase D-like domain-containing protein [Simkaniaceae bacterium]
MRKAEKSNRIALLLLSLFGVVAGVYGFVRYSLHFPVPTRKNPVRLYATHNGSDLRLITLRAIEGAGRSIHIHTYALTDLHVLSALAKKARAGIPVHITCHPGNLPALPALPSFHIHRYRGKGLMHAKWLIIDETRVFLGTANLTTASLVMHDNFLLGFHSPHFADHLITTSHAPYCGTIGSMRLHYFILPDQGGGLRHLLETIASARYRIDGALFTLTHPEIVRSLIEARSRGISVRLFIDAHNLRGSARNASRQLVGKGIRVKGNRTIPLLHHKWALIDQSTLILGSANWTRAAFRTNRDFILSLSPLSREQSRYVRRTITILDQEGKAEEEEEETVPSTALPLPN